MTIGSYLFGIAVVLGTMIGSILGLLTVRRVFGIERLNRYQKAAGPLLSVIGSFYAVLLGFVVVHAFSNLQAARLTAEREANALANIFITCSTLPAKERIEIQNLCQKYSDLVINKEWKAMEQAAYSPPAFQTAHAIWRKISELDPHDTRLGNLQLVMLDDIREVATNRRRRLVSSAHGIPILMWVVLIVGGISVLSFTFFISLESLGMQIFMVALIALTISLNLVTISVFGYPFLGNGAIHPNSMRLDHMIFNEIENEHLPQSSGKPHQVIVPDQEALPFSFY